MSRAAAAGISIPRSSGVCSVTGERLSPGKPYVAALVEQAGSEELVRLDYAGAAWDAGARPISGHLFGYWRGVVGTSENRPRLLIDDAGLLDFFEQLIEAPFPLATEDAPARGTGGRRAGLIFVLALILIRKRLLLVDSMDAGGMKLRFKGEGGVGGGGRRIEVVDPGLSDALVTEVIAQLGAVLSGEVVAGDEPTGAGPSAAL
ncbi:MAG: hypothetical protein H7Y88_06530 [Phycisphaerales bacterium]|nr:hypothetical protein [Phycisphaerales bacterium]